MRNFYVGENVSLFTIDDDYFLSEYLSGVEVLGELTCHRLIAELKYTKEQNLKEIDTAYLMVDHASSPLSWISEIARLKEQNEQIDIWVARIQFIMTFDEEVKIAFC